MRHFVITHKEPPYLIPFDHTLIGVGGYEPTKGFAAKNFIGSDLDNEHALGGHRASKVITHALSAINDNATVSCSSYRLFISKNFNQDWNQCLPFEQRHRFLNPQEFLIQHENLILQELPSGVDLVVCTPLQFPCTVLEQYTSHHLDDLLFAIGCAIRAGLVDQNLVARVLSGNIMIPFSIFTSNARFRIDFTERLTYCVDKFLKEHFIPRTEYQRRCIDFAFERVASIALYQLIINQKLNTLSSTPILITDQNKHIASM